MLDLKWNAGQVAELRVLGDGAAVSMPQSVRIMEFSGKRMRLEAGLTLEGGVPVRLEWEGQLLLGQLLNSEPGGFWIEIHHILLDTVAVSGWQQNGWQQG